MMWWRYLCSRVCAITSYSVNFRGTDGAKETDTDVISKGYLLCNDVREFFRSLPVSLLYICLVSLLTTKPICLAVFKGLD